jgi:hypothetical protein
MATQPIDLAGMLAKITESSRGAEMAIRLHQSLEVTDGLWELVPVVVSASDAHRQRSPAEVADSLPIARRLAPERRAVLRSLGDTLNAITDSAVEHQPVDEAAAGNLRAAEVMADPFGTVSRLMDLPGYLAAVLSALGSSDFLTQLAGMSPDDGSYFATYVQADLQVPRTPLLLRALFAAAVGTVEPLVTRLVQLVLYDATPASYASLADPELDKKAREMCYGSPARWRQALVESLGITALGQAVDWDGLGLLWEARNVIAHRGGLADARYRNKTDAEIGSTIASEPFSVRAAIDEIGAARYAIVAGVWDHLTPGIGGEISESVCIPLWNSLGAGRWRQAEGLARVEQVFASTDQAAATARVNHWLAQEQGHGPDAIRTEVEAWDVKALPPAFTMARHLLLHQDGEALTILRQLVADGTIAAADLTSWPLLERVRTAGLLSELLGEQPS